MKILESHLVSSIRQTYSLPKGDIYVFDNFIITEFNENAIIDQECFFYIYQILDIYSEGKQDFGIIVNRLNNYTLNSSDFLEVAKIAGKKYKTATIVYDDTTRKTALFESQLFKITSKTFTSIDQAVKWIAPSTLVNKVGIST